MTKYVTAALVSICLFVPRLAFADCFDDAANYQHVNPLVLRAIAWQESRGHANATHSNANGTTDWGMMQINSIHLRTLSNYGISAKDLMKPCVSIYIGAWYLRQMMLKHGNTWDAVGTYHSEKASERDKYKNALIKIISEHCGELEAANSQVSHCGDVKADRRRVHGDALLMSNSGEKAFRTPGNF